MIRRIQDSTQSTVGWSVSATGTVGITPGQTLRLSVVNLSSARIMVSNALTGNPHPVCLLEESFVLEPGECRDVDLRAQDLPKELFDETRRTQIRAFIKASAPTVQGNMEIFDDSTGKTTIVLPLRAMTEFQ